MKKNEKQKLFDLSQEELKKKLEDAKKELVNLRMHKATGKTKDLHALLKKRKEIAVVQTIARKKELEA